jgi:hypothetical protein
MTDSDGQVISIKAELEDLRAAVIKLGEVEPRLSFKGLKRLVEQVVQEKADASYQSIQAQYLGGLQDEKDLTSTG